MFFFLFRQDGTTEVIRTLYSPYFPLEVVRDYVMMAISEAVEVNQVHNRDPIGGSNENLFLYVQKCSTFAFLTIVKNIKDFMFQLVFLGHF